MCVILFRICICMHISNCMFNTIVLTLLLLRIAVVVAVIVHNTATNGRQICPYNNDNNNVKNNKKT